MAGMTLANISSYVTLSLEIGSSDISSTLLNNWIQEGYDHIIDDAVNWKFLDDEWTLNTSSSTNEHTLASITNGSSYTPFEIDSVYHPNYGNLERVPLDWARQAFRTTTEKSRPIYYSLNNDKLYLWKRPDQAYALTLGGYRNKVDWIALGSGQQPDCPTEFHQLIARWALGLAYAQQDQPDMTVLHHRAVDDEVRRLKPKYARKDNHAPMVLNRGLATQGKYYEQALMRPLFDFE